VNQLTYVVDGDNLRHVLNKGSCGIKAEDHAENIRRGSKCLDKIDMSIIFNGTPMKVKEW
jgi:adenylylsulfate kinase-like enzyme